MKPERRSLFQSTELKSTWRDEQTERTRRAMRRHGALLRVLRSEVLVMPVVVRRLSAHSGEKVGILDGDGLRVLMDGMVLLGMNLLVLLEVLRPLEALLAYLADVRFEGSMDAEMGGDVVTLGTGSSTVLPVAGEAEIVGRLTADMVVAEVVVEDLGVGEGAVAAAPFAPMGGRGGLLVLREGRVCKGRAGGCSRVRGEACCCGEGL